MPGIYPGAFQVYRWPLHGLFKVIMVAGQTIRKDDLPDDAVILLEGDPDSEAEVEETEALNNMLADLGELDNVKVTVYRVKEGNKTSWVDSFAPSELDIEQLMMGLRQDYGGGKFKIQVRESGRIKKSKIVEVEPPVKKPEGVDTREIIREVQQNQQNESNGMATILAEMIKANQDSQRHQSEQMTTFMTTMVTAMSNNNNQPAPAAIDPIALQASMLQSVQALREMTQPPPTQEPTELILKGVELVNAIKGDGDSGDANIYSVLSSALKSFGGTLGQAMTMAQPPGPNALAAPGTVPQLTNNPAEETAAQPGLTGEQLTLPPDHPLAPFEPYIDYMLTLARKDANPELYAEVIVDQIGPEMAHAWLATDEGINTLCEQLPKVKPYEDWFRAVGVVVDELTGEEHNPGEDQSHQDGDVQPGHDSPPAAPDNAPVDGDTVRASGNQGDVEDNVATGVTIENGHPYS